MDAQEAERRINYRERVEAYFRQHPNEWVPASTLFIVGGRCAWRTRVADARRIFEGEGAVLQNRQQRVDGAILSEYRYLQHQPLARDAAMPTIQKSLW